MYIWYWGLKFIKKYFHYLNVRKNVYWVTFKYLNKQQTEGSKVGKTDGRTSLDRLRIL